MKCSFVIAALLLGACSTVLLLPPQLHAHEPPAGVWYYCDSTRSYYPSVLACKEYWQVEPANPPKRAPTLH